MNPIPTEIAQFIAQHHVVSLACHSKQDFWAASCFYAADLANERLIILTDSQTRHGQLMLANPQVAGTFAAQPRELREIEGVQFQGRATRLEGNAQAVALAHYLTNFPIAEKMQSEVWEIALVQLKHTSNRVTFGQKIHWQTLRNDKH